MKVLLRESADPLSGYLGSKRKLVDWILESVPENVTSVADAFSGSGVVSYRFKEAERSVISNDRLGYCYRIARALVENSGEVLSEFEIDLLFEGEYDPDCFVVANFHGVFFNKPILLEIDRIRRNASLYFDGYKEDIALATLGRVCCAWHNWGDFTVTDRGSRRVVKSAKAFRDAFRRTVHEFNDLVFDGAPCRAYNLDVLEFLPKVQVDLVYFDPPYATEFGADNYEKVYHFVEGLMTNWNDVELRSDVVHSYVPKMEIHRGSEMSDWIEQWLKEARHIPNWMVSYPDRAYPDRPTLRKMCLGLGRDVSVRFKRYSYTRSTSENATDRKEYLFVCTPKERVAMFLDRDYDPPIEQDGPIAGKSFGSVDFGPQEEFAPDWFSLDEEEFLTPGAIKQGDDGAVHFLRGTPQDAFTDRATREVVEFGPNMNPTHLVGRVYLQSDRSELIKESATLLRDTLRSLQPTVFWSQPNLAKMVTNEVQADGHILDGEVIWTVELAAANEPGVHRTQQTTPVRKMRVEVPMGIREGMLQQPRIFLLASNRPYPLTVEGCQLALKWREKPVSRKAPPKVELSWQPERDYRAF